nr:uncharacterized protein LOC117276220 [Nicotiana tomentosiformis]
MRFAMDKSPTYFCNRRGLLVPTNRFCFHSFEKLAALGDFDTFGESAIRGVIDTGNNFKSVIVGTQAILGIEIQLSSIQDLHPICRRANNKVSKVLLQHAIKMFCLVVRLGMETRTMAQHGAEIFEDLGLKVANKARITITNNISRHPPIFHNMSKEESSHLFRRYILWGHNKSIIFRKSIHHDKNSSEISHLGKSVLKSNETLSQRPLWDRQGLQKARLVK